MKFGLLGILLLSGMTGAPLAEKVLIVPIAGELSEAHAALVRRVARKVRAEKPALVVFVIDTPGGRVDLMLRIGEEIEGLPVPTAAFVRPLGESGFGGGAWSAGSYLALSCRRLYMYPGTVIGAAAPVMETTEGVKPVEEKYVSAFREKFRARAEQNGYPPNLAAKMVDKDIEVFEVTVEGRKLYLTQGEIEKLPGVTKPATPYSPAGKLLTMTDRMVVAAGMGKVLSSLDDVVADSGVRSPAEETVDLSWSESLVGFLTSPIVSMILLVVGLFGLWTELKAPSLGVAGTAGAIAFALLLFGHHLAGLAEIPAILLFIAGVGLVAVELFVLPGTGLFAIAGAVSIFVGLVLTFQGFVLPQTPWQSDILLRSVGRVLVGFVLAGIAFFTAIRFLPRVPMLGRVVLQTELSGAEPPPVAGAAALAGKTGHAVTMLRPGGKVEIGGEVYDVVAEGDFVAKGEPIEVLRVEGARIVVGKVKR